MEVVPCLLLCIPYSARFGSIAAYVGKKEGSDIGGSISVGGVIYSVQQILLMFVKNFFLEVAQKKGRTK